MYIVLYDWCLTVDSGIGTDTIGRCNGATAEDFSVIHATNDVRSGDGAGTGAQRMDDSDLSDHASQGHFQHNYIFHHTVLYTNV